MLFQFNQFRVVRSLAIKFEVRMIKTKRNLVEGDDSQSSHSHLIDLFQPTYRFTIWSN